MKIFGVFLILMELLTFISPNFWGGMNIGVATKINKKIKYFNPDFWGGTSKTREIRNIIEFAYLGWIIFLGFYWSVTWVVLFISLSVLTAVARKKSVFIMRLDAVLFIFLIMYFLVFSNICFNKISMSQVTDCLSSSKTEEHIIGDNSKSSGPMKNITLEK